MAKNFPSHRTVHVRIAEPLHAEVASCAEQAGMKLGEFIRHALRLAVGVSDAQGPHTQLNDAQMTAIAARGDVGAMLEMADRYFEAELIPGMGRNEQLAGAAVWLEMAASHGNVWAVQKLAVVQLERAQAASDNGSNALAHELAVMGMVNLDMAADAGSEPAADGVASLASDVPQSVLDEARRRRAPGRK